MTLRRSFMWIGCLLLLPMAGAFLYWQGWMHYTLALSGDPTRQYEYGLWLDKRERKADALMWMNVAADNHEPRALFWMGLRYNQMEHFAYPDGKEAFWYMKEAAYRKQPLAMAMLAVMYEDSRYVKTLHKEDEANKAAMIWYMRAAREGVGLAIDRLVKVYENGELGEGKSLERADEWRNTVRKPDGYWKDLMQNRKRP